LIQLFKNQLLTKVFWISLVLHVLAAIFNEGYHHPDEHFQIIEMASYKAGMTDAACLPWEYESQIRSGFQPMIAFVFLKIFSAIGISNPFFIDGFFRLLATILGWLSLLYLVQYFVKSEKYISNNVVLLLSILIWFVPYIHARFSAESVSGSVFSIALTYWLNKEKVDRITLWQYFLVGFIMCSTFLLRFQMAIAVLAFLAWLIIVYKINIKQFVVFALGNILMMLIGLLTDYWLYNEWTLTPWNYFYVNIFEGVAASFGTFPVWYYGYFILLKAIFPLSLIILVALCYYIYKRPKDVFTWVVFIFVFIHSLVAHKELRFIFPMLNFLIIILLWSLSVLMNAKWYHNINRSIRMSFWGVCITLNILLSIIVVFMPANEMIPMYRKLYSISKEQNSITIITLDEDPYHQVGLDFCFYKANNIQLLKLNNLQEAIEYLKENKQAILFTSNKDRPDKLDANCKVLYQTIPQWLSLFNIGDWISRSRVWRLYQYDIQ